MDKKKLRRNGLWLALLLLGTVWILVRHNRPVPYQQDRGMIFGTLYRVTYRGGHNYQEEIERTLYRFDGSLSPFNDTSVISRINRNEPVRPDSFFLNVFKRSQHIAGETRGAFDITVAPLVNAWGFGFKEGIFPDSTEVDSLLQLTGYAKVSLDDSGRVHKADSRIMLTCSAVAKGYAVDVVAQLLRRKGVTDFMVDIGGEVVTAGHNPQGEAWRIGINKPVDDSLSIGGDLQEVLHVTDAAMATSGNYRNFYYRDGRKYAHTVDPRTGYPVQHEILSATVLAPDCMGADAYATAFMVMGLDSAASFVEQHPELDAYFVYVDSVTGEMRTWQSTGMERYVMKNRE